MSDVQCAPGVFQLLAGLLWVSLIAKFLDNTQPGARRRFEIAAILGHVDRPLQQSTRTRVIPLPRHNRPLGRQRLSQKRLLPTPLENPNGRSDDSFSFPQIPFSQQRARPRLVDLSDCSNVIQINEEIASPSEVLMGVLVSAYGGIKEAKIVLYKRKIALVSGLLKMKTRGCVLY